MYRNTRFGELMKVLPRCVFNRCVSRYQSDKHSKGFGSWAQLLSLIYAQLSGVNSLRELEVGFNSQVRSHYHLGSRRVCRSTLSDANRDRDAGVFEAFCEELMTGAHRRVRREMKELLYLLDSTPICLRGRGYEWTQGRSQSRVPGLKLHVLYSPQSRLPCGSRVTVSSASDLGYGREIEIESGAKYVFDKGYCDYGWWHKLNEAGAYFVTRLKRNASIKVKAARSVQGEIVSDEEIELNNKYPGGGRGKNPYSASLRRVVVARGEGKDDLVLVSNLLDASAEEIAGLYKARWGIELWFKWIKQHLQLKTFLGRSQNAVKIQLIVALITYLLMDRYRRLSGATESFYLWMVELRSTLFQRVPVTDEGTRRRHPPPPDIQGALAL